MEVEGKKHTGIGIAALVLGILGIVLIWVPLVGAIISLPLGILAIIFGALAYWGKNRRDVYGLVGFILGLITIILIIVTIIIAATVYVYVSGMMGPSPNSSHNILFAKVDDTLVVTYVDSSNLNWSDVTVCSGSATLPTGTIDIQDVVTGCSGNVRLCWSTTGDTIGIYNFS